MPQRKKAKLAANADPFETIERIYAEFEQKIAGLRKKRNQQLAQILARLDSERAAVVAKEINSLRPTKSSRT